MIVVKPSGCGRYPYVVCHDTSCMVDWVLKTSISRVSWNRQYNKINAQLSVFLHGWLVVLVEL